MTITIPPQALWFMGGMLTFYVVGKVWKFIDYLDRETSGRKS